MRGYRHQRREHSRQDREHEDRWRGSTGGGSGGGSGGGKIVLSCSSQLRRPLGRLSDLTCPRLESTLLPGGMRREFFDSFLPSSPASSLCGGKVPRGQPGNRVCNMWVLELLEHVSR